MKRVFAIRAPLTATVSTRLVEDGTHVEPDEPVLELEAMKMFTPVSAPAAGTLRHRVMLGELVAEGDVIAVIEVDTG